VLRELADGRRDAPVEPLCRPIRFVPGTKRADDLLREMQRERFQIAIVTDEYGSVDGLVTLENLLEQLVGEIADEHEDPAPPLVKLDERRYRASGLLRVRELNDRLHVQLPHDDWDTVGGLVTGVLGRIPEAGADLRLEGLDLRVERVDAQRVQSVLITVDGEPGTEHRAEGV
jgi:CBS domain containing-hemolysin-like protein